MTETPYRFDDRHITWRPFRGPAGLSFWVLNVSGEKQHVDILFKLDPWARCVPHHHVGATTTFVIEGEHRTYARTPDGWALDQVRPPGTFVTHDDGSIHIEEGGEMGSCCRCRRSTGSSGMSSMTPGRCSSPQHCSISFVRASVNWHDRSPDVPRHGDVRGNRPAGRPLRPFETPSTVWR